MTSTSKIKFIGGVMALIAPPLTVLAHSFPGRAGAIITFFAAVMGSIGGWMSRGAGSTK